MKDTLILFIFLLAVLGLFIGVYCTEDASSENSHESIFEKCYEDNDSVLTITLEKEDNNELYKLLT